MGQCYEKNKEHIKKWRENHKDKHHELLRKYAKLCYEKECYYSYERIAKQLRNIKIN